MNAIISLHNSVFGALEKSVAPWLMPSLARLVFAAVLFLYYWNAATTKLGEGALGFLFPSDGAYIQIFPKTVEQLGYDTSQLGTFHWIVAVAGTWAEFLLPVLIVLGLFTRLAALGMIGFVVVQSWVDVVGHGLGDKDIGAWFDRIPSALILDQRAFWVFVLLYLVMRGAGPLSIDALLGKRNTAAH